MGILGHLSCLLPNQYAGQEAQLELACNNTLVQIFERSRSRLYFHPAYLTSMQRTSCKNWAWWSTSWNQYWWDKYQSPQICKRHHLYDRKWRVTKEALDEGERGEWKTWLKTRHSNNEDHGIWSHHFMAYWWVTSGNSGRLSFLGIQNHCGW